MQSIDVKDLPEPVAMAIAAMVETIRGQVARGKAAGVAREPAALPLWTGRELGPLNRREIYDDAR